MTPLYHPRPERWPQVSLRGLMIMVTLSAILAATVLPQAVAAFLEWRNPPSRVDFVPPYTAPSGFTDSTVPENK